MDSIEKAQQVGIGTLNDVQCTLCNLPETDADRREAIIRLRDAITMLDGQENGRHDICSMFAAYLNQNFRDSGWLWQSHVHYWLDRNHYDEGVKRNLMADITGL